ncbi:RNA-binding protein Jag [Dissulfuribacter thermophilus]|uniref:RNA-binding protein KhpB n=1 Tax=Dissulfuribacter thermophilus TaxID=1156395 RepID=A0A1B9F9C3_9BACT|nr:RNA-binding cell elongation regulator Jag/EloR [Dissulfuribacter thermophilus]OCC16381.1 RNA-binding protein Jag [Dissulfuribacter thermophilus]
METQKIFEGKTVDHAIEDACKYFNCTRDALDVEIITKGSTGIFGIGGRKAQIKVTYKAPEEPIIDLEEKIEAEKEIQEDQTEKEAFSVSGVEEDVKAEDAGQKDAEPLMEEARNILEELISRSNIQGKVKVHMDPSTGPYLNVESDELSLIIGKNGQNLNAYKFIVNLILKRRHPDCPNIEVDAQGYLEKRRAAIENTARRMAEKAKKIGRSVSLDPMNAKERRIVHLAIKKIKGVTTKSVGEGASRRVVIVPQRRRSGSRSRSRQRTMNKSNYPRGRRH